MQKKHYIIVIPGIFKRESFINRLKKLALYKNCQVHIFKVPWLEKNSYFSIVQALKELIREKIKLGFNVSLVGTSAGASIARIIYNEVDLNISHLVTICGPIKNSKSLVFNLGKLISPTWALALAISTNLKIDKNPENILTVIPNYDELVPVSTMHINGSKTLHIVGFEHLYSITSATNKYVSTILTFLKI